MNARRLTVAGSLLIALFAVSRQAECARQGPTGGVPPVRAVQPAQPVPPVAPRAATPGPRPEAAEQTRRALRQVLAYYSPNLGRVLALDPLLLQNPSYLEPYPDSDGLPRPAPRGRPQRGLLPFGIPLGLLLAARP